MLATLKRLLRHLPTLLGLMLLAGAIYVLQKEFRNLKIAEIELALAAIPHWALVLSFIWTILSYGILTFYDRLGTFYAGKPVSYGRVAFASFCAYSLAHNLGVPALSGAAVRYRLYAHWGLTPLQIGKVIAFCSLTFGLGGMVLGGIILFLEPEAIPFFGERIPLWGMYMIGGALWAVVGVYVTISKMFGRFTFRGHNIELPSWRMAILQVLLATVDVAVTAAIFYALLPPAAGLNYLRFLGVYVASYSAGLAANLPGGIGVFDTAMLLGLSPYVEPPQIVGAIVVFRLYYYIIPLFLAGGLFAGNELLLRGKGLLGGPSRLSGVQAIGRWSEPDFVVGAGVGVVALCGAMLLSLNLLAGSDFSWIDPGFAEIANQAGEFIPSVIGAVLLVLSVGLAQRVTLAWTATITLLLLGAGFTVARGEQLWIPCVLVLAAALIAPFHRSFYRHAHLLRDKLAPGTLVPLVALVASVLALAAFEPRLRWLERNSWWEVVLSTDVPNGLRVAVGVTVMLGLAAIWGLVRPGRVAFDAWDGDAQQRFVALGGRLPQQADGLLWGESKRAAVPFLRVGRVLLALGDPVGEAGDKVSTIWRLRDMALQEGLDPAAWAVGHDLLGVYGDIGLAAVPLGPDGATRAEDSDLDDTSSSHYLACKAERDMSGLLPLLPSLATSYPVASLA